MTDTTEHRGWETSSDYHEHWMDDPDYDLSAEDSGGTGFGIFLVSLVVLVIVWFFLGKYLEPPAVTFKVTPPMPQYVVVPQQIDPLHACGKLPACPHGRRCIIDRQCVIQIQ